MHTPEKLPFDAMDEPQQGHLDDPLLATDPGTHRYAQLGPDTVLDGVESLGMRADGRLIALNSYENRVYQVWLEQTSGAVLGEAIPVEGGQRDAVAGNAGKDVVVAKFYRPERWSDAQILEEHAFTLELAEREIPVVAPLVINGATLHTHAGFRFTLFPRWGGHTPEFDHGDTLEWMGRFLGRIHAVGALEPYQYRPALDIDSLGVRSIETLSGGDWLPDDLRPIWQGVAAQAMDGVRHCSQRAGKVSSLRLHGDCHVGNVLWTAGPESSGPHFVDFDDSRMGPAVQDLWMLLSGNRAEMSRQMADVLAGYEDFMEFDQRELHLIEALRTLRLLHYSAWIARRWDDPAFPVAFPWFNTHRYWEDRILELREQIALMQEPPLWSN
jgi:Ser/Thr protein kinase RdoA (MazF antagonist)